MDEKDFAKKIKNEELKDLFTFSNDTKCLTYSKDLNDLTKISTQSIIGVYDIPKCDYISFLKINSTLKLDNNFASE